MRGHDIGDRHAGRIPRADVLIIQRVKDGIARRGSDAAIALDNGQIWRTHDACALHGGDASQPGIEGFIRGLAQARILELEAIERAQVRKIQGDAAQQLIVAKNKTL